MTTVSNPKHLTLTLFDPSTLSLLASNVFIIVLAMQENWSSGTILWIYWVQSVIIGVFNFIRLLALEHFSTKNFTINNQPVSPGLLVQNFTAFFFLLHYGFFHVVYAVFLSVPFFRGSDPVNILDVLIGGAIFFINHFFSYMHTRELDKKTTPNIGAVMFTPYARIIPMHIIIIVGALLSNQFRLVFFMGLKTFIDLLSHLAKHKQASS